MNQRITNSFTLRDALLGAVAIGGTKDEIAHRFADFFTHNSDLRLPFEQAYRAMMQDTAHSFSEKYEYFITGSDLSEDESHKELMEIWKLATGREWKG